MTKPKTKKPLSAEEFIRLWQRAQSPAELARTTGYRQSTLIVRASRFRKLGVPLRRFPSGLARLDIAALERIAKETK
jgi:hypothetical protein